MAPLTDPERLAAFRDAAANWWFEGFINFDLTEQAGRWIQSELNNVSRRELARLIGEFVCNGGLIEEVRERREGWSVLYEFHYDLRFTIDGKAVYVETRLQFSSPFRLDESSILVVNIHAP